MCYTSTVSLTTAIIEFALVIALLIFFKKSTLRNFFAILILLLGIYQFSEFMICTSGSPLLWAKVGVLAFTFLPAVVLHAFMKFVKRKPNLLYLYAIPVFASVAILVYPVITSVNCGSFFIQVETILHGARNLLESILLLIYTVYYLGFLILAGVLFYQDYKKQRNKIKKEIEIVELAGLLLMVSGGLVLLLIFPLIGLRFPSVFCQFALLFAVASFIAVYLENKIKSR